MCIKKGIYYMIDRGSALSRLQTMNKKNVEKRSVNFGN